MTKTTKKIWNPSEEGKKVIELLKTLEGGSVPASILQPAARKRIYRAIKRGEVVYWKEASGEIRLPVWQFYKPELAGAPVVLPGVQAVLGIIGNQDTWRVMRYFLSPRKSLSWQTPLNLARKGQITKLTKVTVTHFLENTW